MDDLQQEYLHRGENVLFLEQDDNNPQGNRMDRFWDAYVGGSAYVPKVIVDSGYRVTAGPKTDYHAEYRKLVNEALLRPAAVSIAAQYAVAGTTVDVTAHVTNLSGQALSPENYATLNVIVYENARIVHTGRFVRTAVDVRIRPALAPGATGTYRVRADTVPAQDWDESRVVVLVDYQPDVGSTRYEALQAVLAARPALPYTSFLPFSLRDLRGQLQAR